MTSILAGTATFADKPEFGALLGSLVTVTGRPGAGKNTVVDELIRLASPLCDIGWFEGKSVTTRLPRPDDKSGEYEHVTPEEFVQRESQGEFLWTVPNNGYLFGTPKNPVVSALQANKISILNLVPSVIPTLHRFAGGMHVVSFFIESSNTELLAQRMMERGSEDAERIKRRLEETRDWSPASFPGFIVVKNEQEERPGFTAAQYMLSILKASGHL